MTIRCSVFIAISLDGFIGREDGSTDWLIKANELAPEGEEGCYRNFIKYKLLHQNTFLPRPWGLS